jgi:hypothetical protein
MRAWEARVERPESKLAVVLTGCRLQRGPGYQGLSSFVGQIAVGPVEAFA